jgi:hypothetical protein
MGVYSKARQRLIEALGVPASETVSRAIWRCGPAPTLLEIKLQDMGDLALIGIDRPDQANGDRPASGLVPVRVPSDVDWIIRQINDTAPGR